MTATISELDLANTLDGNEEYEVVQDGVSRRATADQLQTMISAIINEGNVVSIQAGLAADRPDAGTQNRYYISTDTKKIERDTGVSWEVIAQAPGTIGAGDLGFDPATQAELDAHTGDTTNPHSVTKSQVGLGNVLNKAQLAKDGSEAATGNLPMGGFKITGLADPTAAGDAVTQRILGSSSAGEGAGLISYENGLTAQQAFPAIPLDNVKALVDATHLQIDGLQAQLRAFYSDTDTGGGPVYFDENRDKSTADGGTIIDPDNVGTLSDTALGTFLSQQGTGSGSGCWVRLYAGRTIPPSWFGCREGIDCTAPLKALINAFSETGCTIPWEETYQITRTAGQDYCLLLPATGHWIVSGNGTIDIRASEASAGRGVCGIAWRGGNAEESSFILGMSELRGVDSSTNADGVWVNPLGALCLIDRVSHVGDVVSGGNTNNGLRHAIVEVDYEGLALTAAHFYIERCNLFRCTDTALIVSDADAPAINNVRVKHCGNWGVEIGQDGSRSFAGNSLGGAVTNYDISGATIEKNDGGIRIVNARGGSILADCEANDGAAASRSDAGVPVRPNIDFTGDQSGGHLCAGSSFSGGQANIECNSGFTSGGAFHKDGNPAIMPSGSGAGAADQAAYAPFERYQGPVTTKIGQKTALTLTSASGTFETGETVSDDSTGAEMRVITVSGSTITGTWQNTGSARALFATGNGVTGGSSGATGTIDSIDLEGRFGVIVTPGLEMLHTKRETVASNNTGVSGSASFNLDHQSLYAITSVLEDSTQVRGANYQWYLRDITAGSVITAFDRTDRDYSSTLGNNDWLPLAGKVQQRADGNSYQIYYRNNSGSGADLTGFLQYGIAPVNMN